MPSARPRSFVVSVLPVPATKVANECNRTVEIRHPTWPCWRTTHGQVQRLRQGDVASIGQRCDDQTWLIAEILVCIAKLSIANVREAILLLLVPAMSQLALPHEVVHALAFARDQFGHHVTRVYVDLANEKSFPS